MMLRSIVVLLLISLAIVDGIKVIGQLFCHGKPHNFAVIELWEKDTFDSDDHLKTINTGSSNLYIMETEYTEWTGKPDFYLRIPNFCTSSGDGKLFMLIMFF